MKYKQVPKKQMWLPGFSRPVSAMKKVEKVIEHGGQLLGLVVLTGLNNFFSDMREKSRMRFTLHRNSSGVETEAVVVKIQHTPGEKND